MELTSYTDYALRVLIYAAIRHERLCLISEIAEHYAISRNHLMKVVNGLARGGFVRTFRGKGGGLTLARPPEEIKLGAVVRYMEGPFRPVECFRAGNECVITGPCTLPPILQEAFRSFVATLDRYTLADLVKGPTRLARRLFPQAAGLKAAHPSRA
jgi:Rrf2 family transcriptional regulator, nitric oxide-sensitive transcriptional repressor